MSFTKPSLKLAQAALVLASLALMSACIDKSQFAKVETDDQKAAYSIGYNFGEQIAANTDELGLDVIIAGLRDGFNGSEGKISKDERLTAIKAFSKRRQEAMQGQRQEMESKNKAAGEAFLNENKAKDGVVSLESGLQYEVLTKGEGDQPGATDVVKVHYTGTLIDGTVFDSSVERGEPVEFPLNRVIPGWTEGLQLMKEGAKWKLYVPAELAYGPRGSGAIEPHSTLIFEVELLEVLGEAASKE